MQFVPRYHPAELAGRVLVFDSGIGGLSILRAIKAYLPKLSLTYFADLAGFPYGEKSPSLILERIKSLVGSVYTYAPYDVIVIACNTASTAILSELRTEHSCPIVGVVPAIRVAGIVSRSKVIGLLATPATIRHHYVSTLIDRFAGDCRVVKVGSSELAKMAEAKLRGQGPDLSLLRQAVSPLLADREPLLDTIVLGCTHYPFIEPELRCLFHPDMTWVEPSAAIAKRLADVVWKAVGRQGDSLSHCLANYFIHTGDGRDVEALLPYLKSQGLELTKQWGSGDEGNAVAFANTYAAGLKA